MTALIDLVRFDVEVERAKERIETPVERLFAHVAGGELYVSETSLQRAMRRLGVYASLYDVIRIDKHVQGGMPAHMRSFGAPCESE